MVRIAHPTSTKTLNLLALTLWVEFPYFAANQIDDLVALKNQFTNL